MANPSSILNVDHNRTRRQANTRLLSSAGLLVHEAASGGETLKSVAAIDPHVVLLSGRLPDIGAFDMCGQLRADPGFSSLILLRDTSGPERASLDTNGGPDAWLPERCATRQFLSTVHNLIRLRSAQMELSAASQRSREAAQMVQRCQEESEGFAFQACHDLDEPVRALATFAHMIERDPGRLSSEEQLFLQHALVGVEKLRRLFGSVLSYSQVPRDPKPAPRTVDLNLAAHTAIHSLAKAVQESAATIEVGEALPLVSGSLARLQQVFECLLINAIQYRRPDQPVVIRVGTHKHLVNEVVISVADNGAGIASQYHQVIFQPFKRLHGREIPGAGMGLAICKRIVEAHQGRIWVESEPGCGATFFFSLPQAAPDE